MTTGKEQLMKEARRAVVQGWAAKWPLMVVKAMVDEFGDAAWEVLKRMAEEFGRQRAPILKEALEIDVNDARSLGQIFDFEDSMNGIFGEWIESSPQRAVKREYKCVPARMYMDFPDYCAKLMTWVADATVRAMNPNAEVKPFEKLIPRGDDCCLVAVEVHT